MSLSEYSRLTELSTAQKYEDFIKDYKESFEEGFEYSMARDEFKKIHEYKFSHGDKIRKFLDKDPYTTNINELSRTNAGQRALNRLVAHLEIEQHRDIYKSKRFAKSDFGEINGFDEFVDYYLKRNLKNLEEFEDKRSPGEIYNFFVKYFGFNFRKVRSSFNVSDPARTINYDRERRPNYGNLVTHLTGQRMISMSSYDHSKIMMVEIPSEGDNYDHYLSISQMAGIFIRELNSNPYFVERGFYSIAPLRMYFLLDNYISDERKKELETYFFTNYSFRIHIREKGIKVLLPFSRETPLFGTFNIASLYGIRFESYDEAYQRITKGFEEGSFITRTSVIKGIINKKRLTDGRLPKLEYADCDEYDYSGMRGADKFSYGLGTRHENQVKLAVWSAGRGLTFNEYRNLAYSLNVGGSKDMARWKPSRIDSVLQGYYDFAVRSVKPLVKPQRSEEDVDISEQALFKKYEICDAFFTTYLDNSDNARKLREILIPYYDKNFPSSRQQGFWKKAFLDDSVKLYKFLIRRKKYLASIGKRYVEEGYVELNDGVSFPTAIFPDLKKFLRLRTNVDKIVKAMRATGLLTPVSLNGFEFSYKDIIYSIHYIVLDHHDFLNLSSLNDSLNIKYRDHLIESINYAQGLHFPPQVELLFLTKFNGKELVYSPPP